MPLSKNGQSVSIIGIVSRCVVISGLLSSVIEIVSVQFAGHCLAFDRHNSFILIVVRPVFLVASLAKQPAHLFWEAPESCRFCRQMSRIVAFEHGLCRQSVVSEWVGRAAKVCHGF